MENLAEPETHRDWAALPGDILRDILHRTRHADILGGAGLACSSWRRVAAEDPTLWRHIDVAFDEDQEKDVNIGLYLGRLAMGRAAVDRSAGRCESFRGPADRYLLAYLAARAPSLRSLNVKSIWCLPESFEDRVITKLPMLEELVLCGGLLLQSNLHKLLQHCPRLRLLDTGRHTYTDTHVMLPRSAFNKIEVVCLWTPILPFCFSWSCHFEARLHNNGGEGVDNNRFLCPRI